MKEKPRSAITERDMEVPNLSHLAKIYRDSLANSDLTMASAAEAAALKTSAAEGALAEAISITRFVDEAAV